MLRLIRGRIPKKDCLLQLDFVALTNEAMGHIIFYDKMGLPGRLGGSRMAIDATVVSCESTWICSKQSFPDWSTMDGGQ